ncbi:hypothetical protein GCM10022393_22780 [Aquimarina addita]|uniref:Toxin-antitoxin system YwqK family antitoxin n=1 Tax=Aquimarina addita TaxID=870485 RepID=A0ABP6UNH9_9FLAO
MKTIQLSIFISLYLISISNLTSQETHTILVNTIEATIKSDNSHPQNIIEKLYYKNGELKEVRTSREGVLDGAWKLYYMNGNLKKEGFFSKNKVQGTWKIYDAQQNLSRIENYHNGIEHGVWKEYYANGILKTEGEFIDGKRQGTWKIYENSGKLSQILAFEDDLKTNETFLNQEMTQPEKFSTTKSLSDF